MRAIGREGPAITLQLYWEDLRIFRHLFLIFAILAGQAHACQAIFVRQDGQACSTCEAQLVADRLDSGLQEDGGGANELRSTLDCRPCCQIEPCHADGEGEIAASFSLPVDCFARVEARMDVPLPRGPLCEAAVVSVHVAQHQPNAPPSDRPSRAPPFLLS